MAEQQQFTVEDVMRTKAALENDLEILMSSQGQLQDAQNKFVGNIASLFALEAAQKDGEVMLPLTSTVYALGRIKKTEDRVTVDIGTGYFAELSLLEAVDYYKRKVEYIGGQVANIGRLGEEKRSQLGYIYQALKQIQLQQQQQA